MSLATAPFREDAVARWAGEFAARRPALRLEFDADGNLHLSRKAARKTASPIILSAHMDHPGFVAKACRRAGRLFHGAAEFRGGVEKRFFARAKVRFSPDDPPARVLSVKEDPETGKKTARLLSPCPVPPGALGMWDLPAFRRKGDFLWSRAADDLAGVTAALGVMDLLPFVDPKAQADVRVVLTRAEEVGFWGAVGAARSGAWPKAARLISLEASKALPGTPVGGGPVLRVGDRASLFDDGLSRSLARAAQSLQAAAPKEFRWQRRLMDGGTCEGTAYQAYGYRVGALCVPLLNYHNMGEKGKIAPEGVSLMDLTNLIRWLVYWVVDGADAPPLKKRMETVYSEWKSRAAIFRCRGTFLTK
jgi:endoglucanase